MNGIFKFIIFALAGLASCISPQFKTDFIMKTDLSEEKWEFKQVNKTVWMPATVPGCVHTDLMANDTIEDSFYRLNEKKQQWIDKVDWEYRTVFNVDEKMVQNSNIELIFEGLDTYAQVFLNEAEVLVSDNMFRTYKVDIKNYLKEGENTIRIVFNSPINKGLDLLEANGYQFPAPNDQSENGELGEKKVSTFIRKAPYHFGWDWGPRLVTSGIWKPIYLHAWSSVNVNDLYVNQLNINKAEAQLVFEMEIDSDSQTSVNYSIKNIENNKELETGSIKLKKGINNISKQVNIHNPLLWWPKGYGNQNMYAFKLELWDTEGVLAEKKVKTGLRSIEVVREQENGEKGFYFQVNGVPVFAKGANYIPNDSFVTRVSRNKYKHILQSAVDANMNMLRIWGGGIYEYDIFYELCDSLGIMVWQDFMFACSMYPGNNDFLKSIELEAIDNVKRLRNHPCIALWCGNNEIEVAWAEGDENAGWGWKQRYSDKQRKEIYEAYDTIFYSILPKVVHNMHNEIYYWPSSPIADFNKIATYETKSGDMHYWGVWHGLEKFDRFNEVIPRFMSEFGFQSFPDFQTVKKYTVEQDWDIESEVMASHQRSGIGNLRIKQYMEYDYNIPTDFEQFLYVGQVLQAEGMRVGMEAHRRNKPFCMGTLYWQLNDCWPVASWSGMDYYGKWKAMHYFTKKAFEPYLISMLEKDDKLEVWMVSDVLEETQAMLKLKIIDFNGKVLLEQNKEFLLDENSSMLASSIAISNIMNLGNRNNIILSAEFIQENKVLAKNHYFFEKTKNLKLQKQNPELFYSNGVLEIKSQTLLKNLYLYSNNEAIFSDNYFDVIPGEVYKIKVNSNNFNIEELKTMSIVDTY